MELVLEKHIERTSGVRGGKPRIVGTRITVSDIVVWHFRMGLSLEEIAVKYELSLSAIYAAVSFYFDHKEEIDAQISSGQVSYANKKRRAPSLLKEALDVKEDE